MKLIQYLATAFVWSCVGTVVVQGACGALFLVQGLGFDHPEYDTAVLLGWGGDHPLGRHLALTFRLPGMKELVTNDIITQEAFDRMLTLLEDASFPLVGPAMFGVWTQRP